MGSLEECARMVLDVTPLVMRSIRAELRSQRSPDLSVPQFRVLLFLHRQPESSLSAMASYIGLTLPSMSTMVDGLVNRGLVRRAECAEDRRRVILSLTEEGRDLLEAALAHTQASLASRLASLPEERQAAVSAALADLQAVFSGEAQPVDLTAEPSLE